MNGADPALELTPAVAALSALAAGFAHMVIAWSLASGVGGTLAVFALGGLLAYGAFFALLAPRLGSAPGARLGFVRPAHGSALACGLLLASVMLTSEVDNTVRWLFPLPDVIKQALEAPEVTKSAGAALREGIELLLVEVAVFPLTYELFYRGLVQPVLVERMGPARGVLLGAVIEASASLANPLFMWAWPVVVARSALLGTLRHCSGSLVPSLALSALMGVVEVGAHFELFGIAGFDDLDAAHTPATWLVAAVLPTALGLWLCRRMIRDRAPAGS